MANEALLISLNTIRSITNLSNNLQDKFLVSAVREALDTDFQEIIGQKLYEKLIDMVLKRETTLPENEWYRKLLNEAKYYLAYRVISRVIVISSIKIDNIGANITGDDKVQNLDLEDVFQIESYYEKKSDVYKKKLQNFLIKNYDKYPELDDCDCYNTKKDLYSAASTSIFLGGARGKSVNKITKLRDKYYKNNKIYF